MVEQKKISTILTLVCITKCLPNRMKHQWLLSYKQMFDEIGKGCQNALAYYAESEIRARNDNINFFVIAGIVLAQTSLGKD